MLLVEINLDFAAEVATIPDSCYEHYWNISGFQYPTSMKSVFRHHYPVASTDTSVTTARTFP